MPDTAPQQRPKSRKTPRQARSQETVQVIVEAAARILEQAGFVGFSTNAVADRAGVSIGSLYQYFPRKEALIGALIVRETSLLIDEAEATMTESSGSAALLMLIQACIAHQFRRPKLARLLDFEEARLPFDADTQRVSERFRVILSDVLLRPDLPQQVDHEATTRDVMAIIKGMVDTAGMHGETDQRAVSARVQRAVSGYLNIRI